MWPKAIRLVAIWRWHVLVLQYLLINTRSQFSFVYILFLQLLFAIYSTRNQFSLHILLRIEMQLFSVVNSWSDDIDSYSWEAVCKHIFYTRQIERMQRWMRFLPIEIKNIDIRSRLKWTHSINLFFYFAWTP